MRIFSPRIFFALLITLCFGAGVLEANNITLCKSSDSPSLSGQTFTFDVTGNSGAFSQTVSITLSGVGPTCAPTLENVLLNGVTSLFTITEVPTAGTALTGLIVTEQGAVQTPFTTDLNAESAAIKIEFGSSIVVTFVNSPPLSGNQGCTPGYWKHTQHFASWGNISQTAAVMTVFTGAAPAFETETLLAALQGGGGPGVAGAETILLRAAVAAFLNASNSAVSYPLTSAQIVSEVNAALQSGDRDTMLLLGSRLDGFNNGQGGCPLN
jgi:hypothetical protein